MGSSSHQPYNANSLGFETLPEDIISNLFIIIKFYSKFFIFREKKDNRNRFIWYSLVCFKQAIQERICDETNVKSKINRTKLLRGYHI